MEVRGGRGGEGGEGGREGTEDAVRERGEGIKRWFLFMNLPIVTGEFHYRICVSSQSTPNEIV